MHALRFCNKSAAIRHTNILVVRTTLLTFCSGHSQSSLNGATRHIDLGGADESITVCWCMAPLLRARDKVLVAANSTRHKS